MSYVLITANRNYSSWSLRPWLLMRALGIAFEDRFVPFTKPNNYEEFRDFSPTGQAAPSMTVWASRYTLLTGVMASGRKTPTRAHGRNVRRAKCTAAFPRCAMIAR